MADYEMNRVEFLMKALNLNEIQASLVSELIIDIPNNNLKDFLVFRMKFIDQYKSQELITKEALFSYQRIKIENRLKSGEKIFKTVEQIDDYLRTYYKGKEIGYGLGAFKEYVVIALDKDGNMINTFHKPHGYATQVDGDSKERILSFLLENQNRIGVVKYISKLEVEKCIEHKKKIQIENNSDEIAPEVSSMIKKIIKNNKEKYE